MTDKPTYKELEKQIAELKKQIAFDNEKKSKFEAELLNEIKRRHEIEYNLSKYKSLFEAVIKQAPFAAHVIEGSFNNLKVLLDNDESRRIMDESFEDTSVIDADKSDMLKTRFFSTDGKTEIPLKLMPSPRAFKGEIVTNEEFLFRHASGKEIFVEANAFPIFDETQNIIAVVVTFHDISERKKTEQALKESEEKFRTLISNINGAVYRCGVFDPWEIIYFSGTIYEITGYSPEEFITNKIIYGELIHPDDREKVAIDVEYAIQNHKEYELEYRIKNKNGNWHWIFERGKAVYNQQGKALYLDGVNLDITEKKQAELQLQKFANELKQMNVDKDRFLTILAHDLKSPFNSLLGFSDLLLENLHKYDIDKIEKQLKIISQTTHKTYNLLEDLLLWSKSQAGKLIIEPQIIVFNEICTEIINNLKHQADAKEISINCFEPEKAVLTADLNMFKTILRNLISNAIKFTNKNGQINIYIEKNHKNVTITVSDNGIGIEKDNLPKLWDFTQPISTIGTADEKGTGFGLLLCKEFVEKHSGTIWVESELGKGSDFKFTMPLCND